MIHTGYSGNLLLDDQFVAANRIGEKLKAIGESELKDSYGNVIKTKKVLVPHLMIGNVKLDSVQAGFFEGAVGRQKISVVGGNVLKRFNMMFDLDHSAIYLKPNSLFDLPMSGPETSAQSGNANRTGESRADETQDQQSGKNRGQALSDIEKKYEFVEVWGLKNQSKKEFLTEIMSYPEGICQQSLVKMGYKNGNKLPIPFSNKIIITLRDVPEIQNHSGFEKLENSPSRRWENLKSEFNKLGGIERQQVPFFRDSYLAKNDAAFDRLFVELHAEFKSYGINLDKKKIVQSLETYTKHSKHFSKTDILSALYGSDETIKTLAIFLAPEFLKNKDDLLDFLPLLQRKGSGVQPLLSAFIERFEGRIDWSGNMELLVKLANNPNPFQCLLALRIADKTGFSKKDMGELLNSKMETMKDILQSKYMPDNDAGFLVNFLNKYSDLPIELNKEKLAKRLR